MYGEIRNCSNKGFDLEAVRDTFVYLTEVFNLAIVSLLEFCA